MTPTDCRFCEDDPVETAAGLCRSCHRASTVLLSRRDDGTYQCSLCTIAGRATHLDVHDRAEHLDEVHDIESGDRLATIREHNRLVAQATRGDEQAGLDGWSS